MRNKFAGPCKDCARPVLAGEGYFEKQPQGSSARWAVRCARCVAVGKKARGESLTCHQVVALQSEAPPSPTPEVGGLAVSGKTMGAA